MPKIYSSYDWFDFANRFCNADFSLIHIYVIIINDLLIKLYILVYLHIIIYFYKIIIPLNYIVDQIFQINSYYFLLIVSKPGIVAAPQHSTFHNLFSIHFLMKLNIFLIFIYDGFGWYIISKNICFCELNIIFIWYF